MNKRLGFIGIFLVLVAFAVYGLNKLDTSTHVVKGYILKPRESMLLDFFLMGNASAGDSIVQNLSRDPSSTSAAEIEDAYNQNQAAADQKYLKKTFYLTGVVESIDSWVGNEPYIALSGMNSFASSQTRIAKDSSGINSPMLVQAHFAQEGIKTISALTKGQQLELVCDGAGSIAGTPMLDNCQFASDYAAKKLPEIRQEISNYLKGGKPSAAFIKHGYRRTTVMAICYARSLPSTSACFPEGSTHLFIESDKCKAELIAVFENKDAIDKSIIAVAGELRSLGVEERACPLSRGCAGQEKEDKNMVTSESRKGYTLKATELIVLDTMLDEESAIFLKGGDSILGSALLSTSASEIAEAYHENQVAADQKYYTKGVLLSGQVQEVRGGIGNEPYILLYGVNPLLPTVAHLQAGNIQKIAALRTDQEIYLVCNVNGAIAETPQLKDCLFASDYAQEKDSEILSEVSSFLSGNKVPELIEETAIFAIAVERSLPATSTCFTENGEKCVTDIFAAEKNITHEKIFAIADELKSLGVQVPAGMLKSERSDHGKEDKNIVASQNSTLQNGYTLNAAESVILNALLKDEVSLFSANGDSLLKDELLPTSAFEIAAAYNENQVAADQKYYNKVLYLSGIIQGIKSGIGNEPYISFYGLNEFFPPEARFQDGNIQKIAALRAGQTIYLVCNGDSVIMGAPQFKDCQFAENYAEKRVSEIKSEISDFLGGKKSTSNIIEDFAVTTLVDEKTLPSSSTCFSDGSKCIEEIRSHYINTNNQTRAQQMNSVAEKLKSSGVQVSLVWK